MESEASVLTIGMDADSAAREAFNAREATQTATRVNEVGNKTTGDALCMSGVTSTTRWALICFAAQGSPSLCDAESLGACAGQFPREVSDALKSLSTTQ